jgi:hypothetical protein
MNNIYYYKKTEKTVSCWDMCCNMFNFNFFRINIEYLQQCSHCKSKIFINSKRRCDEVDTKDFDKNAIYGKHKDSMDELENKYKEQCKEREFISIKLQNNYIEKISNYKHYRDADCLNCKKKFIMNKKHKYYCFWGNICYKTVDDYKYEF